MDMSANMPMMNPTGNSAGSPNLYNSISSQGMPKEESMEQSQSGEAENPAEQVITEFKSAFDTINNLLSRPEYQMAAKEADIVKRALQNWLETVVTATSVPAGQQQTGGESSL